MPSFDLSADLRDWHVLHGFEGDDLRALFPLVPTCEFSNMPQHGCECNPCAVARQDWLVREMVA